MPPLSLIPLASTAPDTSVVPSVDCTVILPPLGPLAVVLLSLSNVMSFVARKWMAPVLSITALSALTIPRCRMRPP